VHCLALPFILLALGMTSDNDLLHGLFLLGAMATTGHAVYHSYKKHCKCIVIFFGVAGIALLGADLFTHSIGAIEHVHGNHTHLDFSKGNYATPDIEYVSVLGSIMLIATHIINIYYARAKSCGKCKA